jgi:predicted nucleic acid-binding protein
VIVLDTNIISEMMRPNPEIRVVEWLAAQPLSSMFTTTVTQAEILYGLALLPEGRRRDDLVAAVRPIFDETMAGRILPFDGDAARAYPAIVVDRRQSGHPISQFDAQIAAIVRSRGASLATRNTRDFAGCGIDMIDPWDIG